MATERDLLTLAREKLEREGYTVVLEPPSGALPAEFAQLRPDAIAVGKEPNLLIEVASGGKRSAERVQQIQRALRGRKDWQLHLVYGGAQVSDKFSALPLAEISRSIKSIGEVAKVDTRAAL